MSECYIGEISKEEKENLNPLIPKRGMHHEDGTWEMRKLKLRKREIIARSSSPWHRKLTSCL